MAEKIEIISKNAKQTSELASVIALFFELGDIIILNGGLGAGKTHFVKGFASALGSTNNVTSPTFTIAHFYDIKKGSLLHIDAYRMESIHEFRDTGLVDYFPQSIVLIEWGIKILEEIEDYMMITLDNVASKKNQRKITISYCGDKYVEKFNQIAKAVSKI